MEHAVFVQDRLEYECAGRVYFGEETCERRIPGAQAYKDAVSSIKEKGGQPTIVFPPVTDKGMARVRVILESLKAEEGLECVVNDYGLLDAANQDGPRMEFVIGRLLSRVLAQNIFDLRDYSDEEFARFADSLRKRHVVRFDFDLFNLSLLKSDLKHLPFAASLFTPFDLISFTRRCTIAGCSTTDDNPFVGCKQECRDISFDVSHKYLEGAYFIYENVVLKYAQTPGDMDARVDRVVRWHPPQLRVAGQSP